MTTKFHEFVVDEKTVWLVDNISTLLCRHAKKAFNGQITVSWIDAPCGSRCCK